MKMKNRPRGGIYSIGTEGETAVTRLANRNIKSTIGDALEYVGRTVERETGYYAAAFGYIRGRQLGLTGTELTNYMSDYVAKTQSMYDRYNRASILNNKILSTINPAQSFKLEVMNNFRELLGNNIGTYQEYQGKQRSSVVAVHGNPSPAKEI